MWHPCGTRDTLPKRVPALCLSAMWHPCTLNRKISRARARPTTLSLLYDHKGIQKSKSVSCKEHFSPKSVLHKEHCSDHIVTYKNKGCNPIHRVAAFLSFIARPFSRASSPINPLRLPRDSGKWEQLPLLRIHLAP